jgi:hypothetical protein
VVLCNEVGRGCACAGRRVAGAEGRQAATGVD